MKILINDNDLKIELKILIQVLQIALITSLIALHQCNVVTTMFKMLCW